MRKTLIALLVLMTITASQSWGIEAEKADPFAGQDLHLKGRQVISHQQTTGCHTLVFPENFSMSIGANHFSSEQAVVWLESVVTEFMGRSNIDYKASVYLKGNVNISKGSSARATELVERKIVENGQSMIVKFNVTGEVFVTADSRLVQDPTGTALYIEAAKAQGLIVPDSVIQPEAKVPGTAPTAKAAIKEPAFQYPVNVSPAGQEPLDIKSATTRDGTKVDTVTGRFYIWQKQDELGGLVELLADNTVLYRSPKPQDPNEKPAADNPLEGGEITAVYMSGNVILTEGQRTVRADELYYDFRNKKAIAVNTVIRNFDPVRGIPIYVRAEKLRQIARNKFSAENITITSSEFHEPQISLNASSIVITDTTGIDEMSNELSDASYDAQMSDITMKMGDTTVFYWPFMRSNLERPDVPIKSINIGHDNTFGTSVETDWYMFRVLGLREPKGLDSTLSLDYFGKRGFGTGGEIEYDQDDYFGTMLGYIIRDSGEDRLGRIASRDDVAPPRKLRGRTSWFHRQFLPQNWQMTTAVNYLSDQNFLEEYYRNEFNNGLDQETYVYLKRLEDNWGLDLLAKGQINNFQDVLEELPSGTHHLVGQSMFDDTVTVYSDSQLGRFSQKVGQGHPISINGEFYTFASQRTELDIPMQLNSIKVVPYAASTFGYDDRSGFTQSLVNGQNTGSFGTASIWIPEGGVRASTQYWKVYDRAKSRMLDINQLRHIFTPQVMAAFYGSTSDVADQRNIVDLGLSQRLQTKRGPVGDQEVVDWMALDVDFVWLSDTEDESSPTRVLWNNPIVPPRVLSAPDFANGDLQGGSGLQRFELWGPRRNYFSADYIWRISDTAAVLSDMYYDTQSSSVTQFDLGFTRLAWPNLSYYIGTRYLKDFQVLGQKGTNPVTVALTYVIDPRYTLVLAQQYDFDYGANMRSDVTLIRKYHRMRWGITYSSDGSLDRQSVVFSIWPQGVPELAIGQTRHLGVGGAPGY